MAICATSQYFLLPVPVENPQSRYLHPLQNHDQHSINKYNTRSNPIQSNPIQSNQRSHCESLRISVNTDDALSYSGYYLSTSNALPGARRRRGGRQAPRVREGLRENRAHVQARGPGSSVPSPIHPIHPTTVTPAYFTRVFVVMYVVCLAFHLESPFSGRMNQALYCVYFL